jgi:hypothetical protein
MQHTATILTLKLTLHDIIANIFAITEFLNGKIFKQYLFPTIIGHGQTLPWYLRLAAEIANGVTCVMM